MPVPIIRIRDENGNMVPVPAIRGKDGVNGKDGKDAVVDATLTKAGQAADAAVVGSNLGEVKADLAAAKKGIAEQTEINALQTNQIRNLDRETNILNAAVDGVLVGAETDSEEAYQKTVPEKAIGATIKRIGGKTVVRNQLFNTGVYDRTLGGTQLVAHLVNNHITVSGRSIGTGTVALAKEQIAYKSGHVYLIYMDGTYSGFATLYAATGTSGEAAVGTSKVVRPKTDSTQYYCAATIPADTDCACDITIGCYDLTQWFGADIAATITTPEQAYALGVPRHLIAYDAGTLVSADVDQLKVTGRNLFNPEKFIYTEAYLLNREWSRNPAEYIHTSTDGHSSYSTRDGWTTILIDVLGKNSVTVIGMNTASGTEGGFLANDFTCLTEPLIGSSWQDGTWVVPYGARYLALSVFKLESTTFQNSFVGQGEYKPYKSIIVPIPAAIRALPGYGWSAGDTCNEVDYERKQYIQRVGRVDLGTLERFTDYKTERFTKFRSRIPDGRSYNYNQRPNYLTADYTTTNSDGRADGTIYCGLSGTPTIDIIDNSYADAIAFNEAIAGTMLYYELAEPVITDISDLIPDDYMAFEAEEGGTITFHHPAADDRYYIPVPNEVEYQIKQNNTTVIDPTLSNPGEAADAAAVGEALATKATNPVNPVVGQWGRVASIGEDGQPVWETAELPVQDVQVAGGTVVNDGVAQFPVGVYDRKTPSLVVLGGYSGLTVGSLTKVLSVVPATVSHINKRGSIPAGTGYALDSSTIDHVVKTAMSAPIAPTAGMIDGVYHYPAWTAAEKQSAQTRIGLIPITREEYALLENPEEDGNFYFFKD